MSASHTHTTAGSPPPQGGGGVRSGRNGDGRLWLGYGLAVFTPMLVTAGRLAMGYKPGDAPMLILFLLPPLVSAFAGGLGPGLVATALSGALTNYYLLSSTGSFSFAAGLQSLQWLMMLMIGALVSLIAKAMHRTAQRHRAILDSSLDAIVVIDHRGRIETFSPSAERMFGWQAAAVIGRDMGEVIVPPALRPQHRAGMARFFATGESQVLGQRRELTALRADGTEFPVEVSIVRVGTAAPARFTGFIRDITARRQAEDALRQSEARYRDLVEHSHDLYCTHDLEGNLLSANTAAARLTGYSQAQLLAMNLSELLAPDTRRGFAAYLATIRRHGHAEGVMRIRTATGEERLWEYNNTLRRDDVVAPVVRGIAHDITERKHFEQGLRDSEERFRAIFEQAPLGIAEGEIEGSLFLSVNQRYADIVGYPLEELRTMTFRDYTHPDDLEKDLTEFRRLAAGEIHAYSIEKRYLRKDGATVWVNLSVSAIARAGGVPHSCMAMIEDITERKLLEEQFRQSQKMEAIGQLSGGIAHDFNNIITVIKGRVSLLQRAGPAAPDHAESVREIADAAERAATLTRQLLAFSRRQVMQQRDVNTNELVQNMATMLRRLLGEDVRVQLGFSPEPLWTHADLGMLEQVLLNLAVNARDAMPEGGQLTIETAAAVPGETFARRWPQARPGPMVRLSVRDTGKGIPPEIMPRIFEPFFTTKEVGEGTGLGLATVYGIVQQHHGGIEVESSVGRGTTFHVYLPLGAAAPASAGPAEAELLLAKGGNETILVVEDEPAVQMVARLALERAGYRILEAASGREALDVWRQHRDEIQLLLTDLVMPDGINGHELARQLRQDNPALRVIFTSGYSASVAGRDFPLSEAVNFLAKPYELEQLAMIVRRTLDTRANAEPADAPGGAPTGSRIGPGAGA